MPSSKAVVRYKNEINRASHSLDIAEARIILSAIAQVPRNSEVTDRELYWVSAADVVSLGSGSTSVYQQMKTAAENLFNRYITLQNESSSGRTGKSVLKFRWIQAVQYEEGTGKIGIQFSARILPFISHIQSEFTHYHLCELEGFQNYNTVRLYSMIAQYKSTGKFFTTVAQLRAALELGDKYPAYAELKRRVLLPAVKKINASEKTAFTVTLKEKKAGRRVDSLVFTVKLRVGAQAADANRGDPIGEALPFERIKLTNKQIAMYADFLSGRSEKFAHLTQAFYSDCRKKGLLNWYGMASEQCAEDLRKKLGDPVFVERIGDWLKKVGFRG